LTRKPTVLKQDELSIILNKSALYIGKLPMKARKTIKAKILELRKGKEELLRREYESFQRYLHGDRKAQLYSSTRQQADRLLKRIGRPKEGKEYPLILRRDVYRANTKLTPYWLKIPVHGVRGGINVPIRRMSP
jgi:hypothetical protein